MPGAAIAIGAIRATTLTTTLVSPRFSP